MPGSNTGDEHLYYCQDANYNVTALVEDYDGEVVERYMDSPYGQPEVLHGVRDSSGTDTSADEWSERTSNTFENALLYCGYRFDSETGLYHVRNRYCHPRLGRWLSRDPAGYGDGPAVLYLYTLSSPTGGVDPSGLATVVKHFGRNFSEELWVYGDWEDTGQYSMSGCAGGTRVSYLETGTASVARTATVGKATLALNFWVSAGERPKLTGKLDNIEATPKGKVRYTGVDGDTYSAQGAMVTGAVAVGECHLKIEIYSFTQSESGTRTEGTLSISGTGKGGAKPGGVGVEGAVGATWEMPTTSYSYAGEGYWVRESIVVGPNRYGTDIEVVEDWTLISKKLETRPPKEPKWYSIEPIVPVAGVVPVSEGTSDFGNPLMLRGNPVPPTKTRARYTRTSLISRGRPAPTENTGVASYATLR